MNDMPRQFRQIEILNVEDVLYLINISRQQLWRMRSSGLFPEPLKLEMRRTVWTHEEVLAWMQSKMDSRGHAPIRLRPGDRFINIGGVSELTKLSRPQIVYLETGWGFPPRIQITEGRIVWLEREIDDWIRAQSRRASR
jgi:predicted DNA-binding transcriptional regulator AlpA